MVIRPKGLGAFVSGILLVLFAPPARAGISYYNDFNAFETAVAAFPQNTEPFNAGGLQLFTHVVTTDGGIGATNGVLPGSVWHDAVSRSLGESTSFSLSSSAALYGAGMFLDTSPGGNGQGLSFTQFLVPSATFPFGGQMNVNTSVGPMGGTFFGWTSSDPFSFFTISAGPYAGGLESFDMANLTFAAVPEPAAVAVLLPLAMAAATSRRQRRRRSR